MKNACRLAIVLMTLLMAMAVNSEAKEQDKDKDKDKDRQTPMSIPVTGTFPTGTFNGTFDLSRFALDEKKNLVAVGVLKGTVTQAGKNLGTVVQTLSIPVTDPPRTLSTPLTDQVQTLSIPEADQQQLTCPILHLNLGPLDLNLLGLLVHLDIVVLDLSAEPGAGNLLGNLLCAVVGLLNGPAQGLVNTLNQILGAL